MVQNTENRVAFVTTPEIKQELFALGQEMGMAPSKIVHLLVKSFLNVDIKKYLELYQGQALVGFDISKLVNDLVLDRYPTTHNQQQV